MGRSSDAKQKIIDTARELFWRNGFEATGISQILDASGVGSGSLYWFFKSKEDLLAAVLRENLDLLNAMIVAPAFERSDDPLERIFCIFAIYRELLLKQNFRMGCPIGNIVLELGDRYEKVRQLAMENFDKWRNIIKDCLENASERFSKHTDFKSISIFVLTIMEGAIIQARAHKDITYFDESNAHLRRYFDSLLIQGLNERVNYVN